MMGITLLALDVKSCWESILLLVPLDALQQVEDSLYFSHGKNRVAPADAIESR